MFLIAWSIHYAQLIFYGILVLIIQVSADSVGYRVDELCQINITKGQTTAVVSAQGDLDLEKREML